MIATPIESNASRADNWISTCIEVGRRLDSKNFRYGNSSTKKNYNKALSTNRRSNCALFVSWCLQEHDILKKNQVFYVRKNGSIKKNFSSWRNASVLRVYNKRNKVRLQEGDIVCWKGIAHVNVYAGNNMWIDGGKVSTYRNKTGSKYHNARKEKKLNYLNKKTISYIIRIKSCA